MLPLAAQDKGQGGVLESRSLLQRYGIAARAEAFHAICGGHPDIGQVAKFLARLRIGEVNLDHWHLDRLDRIEQRDRGVGIGRRVQQHRASFLPVGVMQPVDQLAFVIGLVKTDRQPQLFGLLRQHLLDIGERLVPVDLRLALAEEVKVRAVEDEYGVGHQRAMKGRRDSFNMFRALAGLCAAVREHGAVRNGRNECLPMGGWRVKADIPLTTLKEDSACRTTHH